MKLVVDGVFFQLAATGIARVWASLLPRLSAYEDLEIFVLDRGNLRDFDGLKITEFPSYTQKDMAADSLLLDQFCRNLGADVFLSTYYTTPTSIPSVLVVHDMIPEILGIQNRVWQEKELAISYASYYACVSENTRRDLLRFYPAIDQQRAMLTYNGLERDIFYPRGDKAVEAFKREFEIRKPYFLLVGSRQQVRGYKNALLLFKAASLVRDFEFEILCVGGEPEIPEDFVDILPANVSARRVELTDDQLALAYSGAEALVYPSLYEGFGMPVIEAMGCGCPVITTDRGSLAEVSAGAALKISGEDEEELAAALRDIREPAHRRILIEKGLKRSACFSWDDMARGVYKLIKKACEERHTPSARAFYAEWTRLRSIQAEVDVGL